MILQRAIISGAIAGDNTLVAALAGAKIRVYALYLRVAGAVAVRFESGAGGTALTGVMSLPANGELNWTNLQRNAPLLETAAGALLNMELGGAVQASGWLIYSRVADGV